MQKGEVKLKSMALEHELPGREFRCPLFERVLMHMLTDLDVSKSCPLITA
jgi:hypothetical protein